MAKKAAARKVAKEPEDPTVAPKTGYRRKVRATQLGYYGHGRRREGDVFYITDPQHFSEKWMEDADPSATPRKTGAQRALNTKTKDILGRDTGHGTDPLGAGE